ncbi:MAG: cysteine hydrolase [Thermomicrobium sp.]|nr:cysteine hydrolase [Thermomicrobium sp.]
MQPAVVVIDMLNDFVTGKLGNERVRSVVEPIRELLAAARAAGIPVVYVGDAHLPSDPEIAIWGPHAMKGTKEAETIPELAPQSSDFVLEKRTYSAFYETGLDLLLRSLGVDTVVITGLHTNICCRHTAADAFARAYKIVVPEDCVNAFTEEEHRDGIEYLRRVYGARITTSGALVREWQESRAPAGSPTGE